MLAARTASLGRAAAALARASRAAAPAALRAGASCAARGMAQKIDFGGELETVYERSDFPKAKYQAAFAKDTLAMLGYGTQGRGQALNARDNGLKVIVGLRKGGASWELAKKDGFIEGKTLFPVVEAAQKGTVIMYLLSDAGQKMEWASIQPALTKGKTLYFAHGFSVVFKASFGGCSTMGREHQCDRGCASGS